MKRLLIITGLILGAVIVIAALGTGAVTSTPWGRGAIISFAEPRIAEAVGGEAEIGALEGALPGEIILRDVVLSEEDAPWLTIERVRLVWRPWSLLGSHVKVDSLEIENAAFLAMPPSREETDAPPKGFELPTSLPAIDLTSLDIAGFSVAEEIAGAPLRLDGTGALKTGGREIKVRLNASSEGDSDIVDIFIDRDPASDRLVGDLTIKSDEQGAIVALAELGGPFFLEATTDSPVTDLNIALQSNIGAYGDLSARLQGDLADAQELTASGAFTFGQKLSAISTEIGEEAAFAFIFNAAENGAKVTVSEISSSAGAASGTASWENRQDQLQSATISLTALFGQNYRTDIQDIIGERLTINANIEAIADAYRLDLSLAAPKAAGSIEDATSDLQKTVSGPLRIELSENEKLPAPLQSGGVLRGDLALDLDDRAALSDLSLRLAGDGAFDGNASYVFDSENISLNGAVILTPDVIAALAPSVIAEGAISGDASLKGRPDMFTATIDVDTPRIRMNDAAIPAAAVKAAMSGLPNSPTGDISARARNGAGALNAELRSTSAGDIAVPSISFTGRNFKLNGAGAYNPEKERGRIDLTYAGDRGAQPWPGVPLEGDLTAKGELGRASAQNRLSLKADRLQSDGFAVAGLDLVANGPANSLTISGGAKQIDTVDAAPITDLSIEALADIGDKLGVRVNALSMDIAATPFQLTSPLQLNFDNGVEFQNLVARLGRNGSISGDGAFSSSRWRADIKTEDAVIPGAATALTLALSLDTDKQQLASGDFVIRTLLTELDETEPLTGVFTWNGDALRIRNTQTGDALDIDLSLPLKLVRRDGLTIETEGSLDGTATYDGRLEPIAAFLPTVLQTFEGGLRADAAFAGTLDAPEVRGEIKISDGAYTEPGSGLSLVNIQADASARAGAGATTISINATARGPSQDRQTITAEGEITLGETSSLSSVVRFDEARFVAGPVSSATASGELSLKGSLDALAATGEINVEELNASPTAPESTGLVPIEVIATDRNGEPIADPDVDGAAPPISINIGVKADDQIFIRGRGLESEWDADIRITGNAENPLVLGRMSKRRGWIDFAGRRFDLAQGRIEFDRLTPNDPILDLRAEYETGDGVLAAIVISGRASAPSIELESTPTLPQEDIMALVLFGKPANELSAFETLQMAEALAKLGGVGPFGGGGPGLTGSARQALGLDLLNIDLDSDTGASALTVGKYVADGLFVSATQDARGENGSVSVEYDITNSISIETELQQNGDQTVSANWKRDF